MKVGNLFRTRAFNFHARKAAPPRSLDTLTLRELYALKTETSNRALSAKMLADIYKRLESIHVQSTCRINTPLITQCLQSPIVSRNAQLAKHHSPAASMAGTAKPADKFAGTMGGSVSVKSSMKDKGSGTMNPWNHGTMLMSLLVPVYPIARWGGVVRVRGQGSVASEQPDMKFEACPPSHGASCSHNPVLVHHDQWRMPLSLQCLYTHPLHDRATDMVSDLTGVGGGALSATPVWVDANGMATDDSTLQLDTLRDILMGRRINLAGSGALRSEKSLSSVSSRPSLAGLAPGRPDSVLALVH